MSFYSEVSSDYACICCKDPFLALNIACCFSDLLVINFPVSSVLKQFVMYQWFHLCRIPEGGFFDQEKRCSLSFILFLFFHVVNIASASI